MMIIIIIIKPSESKGHTTQILGMAIISRMRTAIVALTS